MNPTEEVVEIVVPTMITVPRQGKIHLLAVVYQFGGQVDRDGE